MPVPLPLREAITRTLRDNEGRPIEVREWVRENLYKPLDGFKAWPRGKRICPEHAARVGEIKPKRALCRAPAHEGCDGLRGYKIAVVVADVSRQDGKTTGAATYEISDLVAGRNCHCLYFAAAEGQAARVFDQKFVGMLRSQPVPLDEETKAVIARYGWTERMILDGRNQIAPGMDSLTHAGRNNDFLYVPTSAKSVASGTQRLLVVDEMKDVEDEVLIRALPMILSVTGVECAHGHFAGPRPRCRECGEELEGFECEAHGIFEAPSCPVCRIEMDEFFGRALLCSSAGEESATFSDLVATLKEMPDPSWHLFSTSKRLNTRKSKEINDGLVRVLSRLPNSEGLVNREFGNIPGRKGDEYLSSKMIDAVTDASLVNANVLEKPCVAFLDCSLTTDLTSLVVCGEDAPEGAKPWSRIAVARIDVFDPKDAAQFHGGRVRYMRDPKGGTSIQQHLDEFIPRFPSLVELWIDVAILEEARDLLEWAMAQPWRSKVRKYPPDEDKELVKKALWDALEARVLAGPGAIRIPNHERLRSELRSAKTKVSEAGIRKVMDSGKGDRRGKRRQHRDVSMSLAGCCWVAGLLLARNSSGSETGKLLDRLNKAMATNSRFRSPTADILNRRW